MSGDGGVSVSVSGGDSLDKAVAALEDGRYEIAERIGEVLHDLAEMKAQSAAIRIFFEPVHGVKQTGLREEVAEGVGVIDISGGSRVITSMPESDEAAIPRGFDSAVNHLGGWRHPLFGDSPWYRNFGEYDWFLGAFEDASEQGAQMLQDMLEEVAQGISDKSG